MSGKGRLINSQKSLSLRPWSLASWSRSMIVQAIPLAIISIGRWQNRLRHSLGAGASSGRSDLGLPPAGSKAPPELPGCGLRIGFLFLFGHRGFLMRIVGSDLQPASAPYDVTAESEPGVLPTGEGTGTSPVHYRGPEKFRGLEVGTSRSKVGTSRPKTGTSPAKSRDFYVRSGCIYLTDP